MKQCLRITAVLFLSYILCVSPLFPYSARDVIEMQGSMFSDALPDTADNEVLIPGPFDRELTRAGKIWNPSPDITIPDEPILKEPQGKTPEPAEQEPAETASADSRPVYISAGPDCCGYTGSRVYIGTEKPVPGSISLMWRQTQGFPVYIDDPEAPFTFFIPESAGVYVFALDASGPDGYFMSDSVQALVDEKEGNHVPTAYAGCDRVVKFDPDEWITLAGKGCDADGDMLDFAWKQTGGPEVSLFGADTDTLDILPSSEGIYTFELTVSDGMTDSLPDTVWVQCFTAGNKPPVADAEDMTVCWEGTPRRVVLNGSMSCDPEGAPLNFEWKQTDGPPVVLSSPYSGTTGFTCSQQGYYWFELSVDDGQTESVPTEVSVTVMPETENENGFEGGGCRPGSRGNTGSAAAAAVMLCILAAVLAGIRRQGTGNRIREEEMCGSGVQKRT